MSTQRRQSAAVQDGQNLARAMRKYSTDIRPKPPPQGLRLIDLETGIRTRPMKVLALGMSRTGTSSLRDALIVLGHRPYHFRELMLDYRRYIPLWTEALEAKYFGKGAPYGRREFDKLIGDFDAVEDNPSTLFVEDLVKAYPEAKVVLTNRNVDSWVKSMQKTIMKTNDSWIYKALYRFHPLSRAWFPFSTLLSKVWYENECDGANAKERFIEHYQTVRNVVPKENLLELEFGDGWEPLCKFLDVPIPPVPYPHSNDSEVFSNRHKVAKAGLLATLIVLAGIITILVYVPQQAVFLHSQDPSLFFSYLKIFALLSLGAVCGGQLINRHKDIEKVLYQDTKTMQKI